MNRTRRNFIITGLLFFLFAVLTAAIKTVDVKAIGPEGSAVGLATVNQFMFQLFGVHLIWYDITDWLGVAAILIAFCFAVLGLCQLIQKRSILKVDYRILLLGVFYVLVIGIYVFFEVFIVNYRPIILHTGLEASYPSSHTMIVICIMSTAIMMFNYLLKDKKLVLITVDILSALIIAVTVIGRLISGVHWFTDIVAGILLSAALVMLYYSFVKLIESRVGTDTQKS